MHKFYLCFFLSLGLCACGSNESDQTPPAWPNWSSSRTFQQDGKTYAPADFEEMILSYKFYLSDSRAIGSAEIKFRATADGFAYFLSDPSIESSKLDGDPISISGRSDPDGLNTLRVIPVSLKKGDVHRLNLDFVLPASRVSLHSDGLGFLTTMSDMGNGNYFEAYAPSNFEMDAFHLDLSLEIIGNTVRPHSLFANGKSEKIGNQKWKIDFPSYYTSSSFYVHLTDTPVYVRTTTYQGQTKAIPITVYSREPALADEGLAQLPALFAELESTYGPFMHETFIAYISGRGGMEHAGATITSNSALGHELTHSWFARGVMPSDGRSGWIDEAIASWRDYGYFRARQLFSRGPTNLGRASAFQRFTPTNCYHDGRLLLSEIDLYFADQGGLRPLLRSFYEEWKGKTVTTNGFRDFLEAKSGASLHSFFQSYVYSADPGFIGDSVQESSLRQDSLHPPPLSEKEILWLR